MLNPVLPAGFSLEREGCELSFTQGEGFVVSSRSAHYRCRAGLECSIGHKTFAGAIGAGKVHFPQPAAKGRHDELG
jgi:hypothetical protein